MGRHQLGLLLVASTLTGCETGAPQLNYRDLASESHRDSSVLYQLTDTTLVIGVAGKASLGSEATAKAPADSSADKSKAAATADAKSGTLVEPVSGGQLYPVTLDPQVVSCSPSGCGDKSVAAAAVPIPFVGPTLAIDANTKGAVRTSIAPTYYPHSMRLRMLVVASADRRKEILDMAGNVATGVAQLAVGAGVKFRSLGDGEKAPGAGGVELKLPVVVDLAEVNTASDIGRPHPLPDNPGWTYTFRFLDADPDKSGFLRLEQYSTVHSAMLTSLCRPMQIELDNRNVQLKFGVTVADPHYLFTVPLPSQGVVTLGELCGADVTAGPLEPAADNILVGDFFSQAEAVRAALKHK